MHTATAATPLEFTGTRRFQVLSTLGMGGMGAVYEVLDLERGTRVALKMLHRTRGDDVRRFRNEFRARQDLDHPNLVRLGELFEEQGRWFFTMELVQGVNLLAHVRPEDAALASCETADLEDTLPPGAELPPELLASAREAQARTLRAGPTFDEQRLRSSFAQLARGLIALHQSGKVHRDIKPSNVLVTPEGRVVILDFGLVARHTEAEHTDDHALVGTLSYMSPEQASAGRGGARVGPPTDWYSVGVMVFQALTGRLPFIGSSSEVWEAKLLSRAPRASATRSGIPADLDELCDTLLRRHPHERPDGRHVMRILDGVREHHTPIGLRSLAAPFIARKDELAQLRQALEVVKQGSPVSVFIEAESGQGKSSLLRSFASQLAKSGEPVMMLAGQCYERESIPYKGLDGAVDKLSRRLRTWPAADLTRLVDALDIGLLAQAFPTMEWMLAQQQVRPVPHDHLLPQIQRERVMGTVFQLFRRIAERQPLVLILDDLQWAAQDSLALLAEMTSPPSKARLLLVATVQVPGPLEDAPALQSLPMGFPARETFKGNVWNIKLGRLSEEDSIELARAHLERLAGAVVDPAAVAREAAGHPRLIEELCHYLTLHPEARGQPPQLEDVVQARLRDLEPAFQQVLDLVALAGLPIRQDVLARALGAGNLSAQLTVLSTAKLVRTAGSLPEGAVELYHDRIRRGVLQRMPPGARRDGHAKLAGALETLLGNLASSAGDADPSESTQKRIELAFELAYHFDAADEPERAFPYALVAMEAARRRFAMKAAERFADIAWRGRACAARGERLRLAHELGKVHLFLGHQAKAAAAFQEALELADSNVAKARQLRWLGEVSYQQEAWLPAIDAWKRGLRLLGQSAPRRVSRLALGIEGLRRLPHLLRPRQVENPRPVEEGEADLLAVQLLSRLGCAQLCHGDLHFAIWAHLRSLSLAVQYQPTAELALAYANHSLLVARYVSYERASAFAERAVDISQELGDELGLCGTRYLSGFTAFVCTRYHEAVARLEDAVHRFEALGGSLWESASARMVLVLALYQMGSLEEARILSERLYLQLEAAGYHFLADNVLTGWLMSSGGNVPDELVQRALDRAGSPFHRMWALHAQAQRLMAQRDFDGAITALEGALECMRRTSDIPTILHSFAVALRCKAAQVEGRARRALLRRAKSAIHRAQATARGFAVAMPAILRERALIAAEQGATRRALKLLEQSLDLAERQEARFEHAQSLFARGRLRARAGLPGGLQDMETASDALRAMDGVFALDALAGNSPEIQRNAPVLRAAVTS